MVWTSNAGQSLATAESAYVTAHADLSPHAVGNPVQKPTRACAKPAATRILTTLLTKNADRRTLPAVAARRLPPRRPDHQGRAARREFPRVNKALHRRPATRHPKQGGITPPLRVHPITRPSTASYLRPASTKPDSSSRSGRCPESAGSVAVARWRCDLAGHHESGFLAPR